MAMAIVTVAPKADTNPFSDDIKQLSILTFGTPAVGDKPAIAGKPDSAGAWVVPTADAGKSKYKIGKAANAIDRTAALVSETVEKRDGKPTGNVVLTFRLKAKHQTTTRNRTPKAVESTSK